MSRFAYIITFAIMLGLVYFIFLSDDPERIIHVFPEPLGASFELRSEAGFQEVKEGGLLVDNVTRQLSKSKFTNLVKFLRRCKVKEQHVIRGVEPEALSDYALNGDYELTYAGQRYRWSTLGKDGFIWHEQKRCIYAMRAKLVQELSRYAGRLDENALLNGLNTVTHITIDDLYLERVTQLGGWMSPNQPHRPPFNSRGAELLSQLGQLTLDDVQGVEPSPQAKEVLNIVLNKAGEQTDVEFVVDESAKLFFVKVTGQPLQKLSSIHWQRFKSLRASFKRDFLLDIPMGIQDLPFDRIVIKNGGIEQYRIQRYGSEDAAYDVTGYSYWELVWPDGREPAAPDSGYLFFNAFNDLEIEDVSLQPMTASVIPDERSLTVEALDEEGRRVCTVHYFDDDHVQSEFHRGKLTDASDRFLNFKHLKDPASFLNPYVLPCDMRRIEKIQRLDYRKGSGGEILKRHSLSQWQLTQYAKPNDIVRSEEADAGLCNRLALTIGHLRAKSVSFAELEDIKQFAHASHGFDVHLSAWDIGNGEDEQFLEETLARDWGMRLMQKGEHWLALNREETLIYELDADDVEQLFVTVSPGYIFGGVPGQIEQIRVQYEQERFVLQRNGLDWQTQVQRQWVDVDALQMRVFLRALSRCRAQRIQEVAHEIDQLAVLLKLQIFLPGLDERREQITIVIGQEQNGQFPVTVHASAGTQTINGLAWCDQDSVNDLLHDRWWFIPADQIEALKASVDAAKAAP